MDTRADSDVEEGQDVPDRGPLAILSDLAPVFDNGNGPVSRVLILKQLEAVGCRTCFQCQEAGMVETSVTKPGRLI